MLTVEHQTGKVFGFRDASSVDETLRMMRSFQMLWYPVLVATVGIEPTTFALSRRYSTTELRGYGMVPSEGVEPSSSRFVGATPVPLDQVLKYFADRPGIEPGSFSVNSGAPTPCLLAVSKVLLVLRRRRDSNPYHPLNRRITIH